jgi:hypothetical protein
MSRFPEDHGTWTVSREAVVDLRLAAGLGPVVLQAKLISFLCPGRQRMRVDVALDEALAARWCFRGDRSQESIERIELPASSGAAIRPLRLRFVIHDPLSPAAAGVDSTAVAIGISLAEISLQPRQEHRELAAEPGAL